MTDSDRVLLEQMQAIEKAGAAVENHCECGAPYSQHQYWEDRIYDLNGYRCPNQPWSRDYRHNPILTEQKRLEAKAAKLAALLSAPQTPEPTEDEMSLKDRMKFEKLLAEGDALRESDPVLSSPSAAPQEPLLEMEARKDAAYEERNRVVAALAQMAIRCGYKAGIARTAIEGWSDDWHGCVYIEGPWGQASWHYHDSHAPLFASLPAYEGTWDGHTTEQKYERLASYRAAAPSGEAQKEREKMIMLAVEGIEEWTRTIRQELLAADLLAASQGVSAPAVAEIEQEMRKLAETGFGPPGLQDLLLKWADRLAALRGEKNGK